jgi:hypothetical protein
MGKAGPLCPSKSDIDLFGYGNRIVDLDSKIPNCAFDLSVTQQQLLGTEIASAAVDQSC